MPVNYRSGELNSMRQKQEGVVLAVCMIFIVVLTVIGVSALERSELEERMSTNFQEQHRAFQVAETGIAQTLANLGLFNTESSSTSSTGTIGSYGASSQQSIDFIEKTQVQRTQAGWGVSTADFYHYNIASVGSANRGAKADLSRGVRIIGALDEDTLDE